MYCTISCMITRYQVYKNVWSSCIGEVLYCHCDERSAERAFRSGTGAKQNWIAYSLKVLVKRHRLIKLQDTFESVLNFKTHGFQGIFFNIVIIFGGAYIYRGATGCLKQISK